LAVWSFLDDRSSHIDKMKNNYQENPVEGFGKKILSSQGWFQGRGIGKSSKGEITPFSNYTGRSERSGLGSDKEFIKKQKSELKLGDSVEVTKGKHQGLIGTLLQIEEESATIEIKNSKKHI
jgi:transcription antitermination factor NusG